MTVQNFVDDTDAEAEAKGRIRHIRFFSRKLDTYAVIVQAQPGTQRKTLVKIE